MGRPTLPSREHQARRSQAALFWGVALFVAGQAVLNLALDSSPLHLGDPEYGQKLANLHARLAESPPDTPLVMLLGSYGVECGGTRRFVACSNANASSSRRPSLHAIPVKLTP